MVFYNLVSWGIKKHYIVKLFYISFLLILSLFACFGWLNSAFPATHESFPQIYTLMDFDKNIVDGNLLVNWLPNFAGGGQPVFDFYPPLAYYILELFHLLGFSFAGAIKIGIIMSFFLSGIAMFFLVRKISNNNAAALISAATYIFFPYHLVDSHVRGDIAETFSFVFLPLILYFLYDMFKKDNFAQMAICAGISYALLILTHILISYLFAIFILIYFLYILITNPNQTRRIFYSYFIFGFSALILSIFYWLPALLERNYVNFAALEANPADHYIFLSQLLLPSQWVMGGSGAGLKNTMPLSIGLFAVLILILSFYLLAKDGINGTLDKNQFIFLFCALISLLLTTNYGVPIFGFVPLSNLIQFPWRILAISAFFISILAGYVTKDLSGQDRRWVGFMLLFFLLISSYQMITIPAGYIDTANITNASGFYREEYLPVYNGHVFRPLPEAYPDIIYKGQYEIIKKSSTYWRIKTHSNENLTCAVKIFYFPRWICYIDGVKTNTNISAEGTIALDIPQGSHLIEIKYENSFISIISRILSLLGLISIMIVFRRSY